MIWWKDILLVLAGIVSLFILLCIGIGIVMLIQKIKEDRQNKLDREAYIKEKEQERLCFEKMINGEKRDSFYSFILNNSSSYPITSDAPLSKQYINLHLNGTSSTSYINYWGPRCDGIEFMKKCVENASLPFEDIDHQKIDDIINSLPVGTLINCGMRDSHPLEDDECELSWSTFLSGPIVSVEYIVRIIKHTPWGVIAESVDNRDCDLWGWHKKGYLEYNKIIADGLQYVGESPNYGITYRIGERYRVASIVLITQGNIDRPENYQTYEVLDVSFNGVTFWDESADEPIFKDRTSLIYWRRMRPKRIE